MDKNVYATITGVPMGFEAFVEAMRERLQDRYPDCNIRVGHADKNNGVHLTGIVILPEGQNAAPNIYMESFYSDYLAGRRMEDLADAAARFYEGNKLQEDFMLPDMTDFEAVKGLICFRLINRERNRERLEKMPHRDFLDLAVIYFVPVTVGVGMGGSITIKDYIYRLWQTDEETVYRYALENTRRLYPATLQSMEDVIREMMGDDAPAGLFSERNGVPAIPLYVLRCYRGDMSSAAAMLYDDILREFGRQHGNFYILPSSIYEVLLMPAGPGPADASFVCPMVRDVNRAQVAPEEVLSDNAYFYHADTGVIDILE